MIAQRTSHSVAVCGPLAEPGEPATGGYEAANARTIKVLDRPGAMVTRLAYPSVKTRSAATKFFSYKFRFFALRRRIMRLPTNSVVHFTPLCRHFLAAELTLIVAAKRNGCRIVIDLRAGTKDVDFAARSILYRKRFRRLVAAADAVAVEGERYVDFIRGLRPDVPVHYLPNVLPDADIPQRAAPRSVAPIRFVYVGSITEAKGLLHAVRLVDAISERGHDVRFDVFGWADAVFAERLRDAARKADWLVLHGPQPYETIRESLSRAHFFLFLTTWRGEGHSNALTEAMSQGVIPIVTDHGFNRDVVGSVGVVVEDRDDVGAIVTAIEELLRDPAAFDTWSQALIDRVRTQYSETAIAPVLRSLYGWSASNP